jgi:hypothetical protein
MRQQVADATVAYTLSVSLSYTVTFSFTVTESFAFGNRSHWHGQREPWTRRDDCCCSVHGW